MVQSLRTADLVQFLIRCHLLKSWILNPFLMGIKMNWLFCRHSGAALQGAPPGPRADEQHIPGQGGGDILHGHRAEEAHSHHSGKFKASVPFCRSLYGTVRFGLVRFGTVP